MIVDEGVPAGSVAGNGPGLLCILTRRALPKPGALLLPGALGATRDLHHGLAAKLRLKPPRRDRS